MQKPKNLLPGLFLCVFSRILEPLVDFIAVIFGFSFFYLGQIFFAGKKGIAGPFYTGPFCTPLPRKAPRTPKRPKGPTQKTPGASSTPKRAFGNTHPKSQPRTPRIYKHAALFGMPPRPTKGPRFGTPPTAKNYPFGALYRKPCLVYAHKRPPRKNPGSKSRGFG